MEVSEFVSGRVAESCVPVERSLENLQWSLYGSWRTPEASLAIDQPRTERISQGTVESSNGPLDFVTLVSSLASNSVICKYAAASRSFRRPCHPAKIYAAVSASVYYTYSSSSLFVNT